MQPGTQDSGRTAQRQLRRLLLTAVPVTIGLWCAIIGIVLKVLG